MNTKRLTLTAALAIALFTACQKDIDNNDDTQTDDSTSSTTTKNDDSSGASGESHEAAEDYIWDASSVVSIVLDGTSITEDSPNVTVSGSTATITEAGNYSISGTLSNGQIIVNTTSKETVRLILNGANITCSNSAPIFVNDAKKVIVVLADNTTNTLTDGTTYTYASADVDEPNAPLYSKADMTIYGSGTLTVKGNYADGINGKDGLILKSGTINVTSKDDGIRGKDYLIINDANTTVSSGGDGLKSDNEDNSSVGYITFTGGITKVTSTTDGISAQTCVLIENGTITSTSGGGSSVSSTSALSRKGIKGVSKITVNGGSVTVSSADDALHTNSTININGGTLSLSSADDGIHSDTTVVIAGGDITISKSYEGVEGKKITFSGGASRITASNDALNSSMGTVAGGAEYDDNSLLTINGGYVVASCTSGDAVDSNGDILLSSGTLIIHGPTSQMEEAVDFNGSFNITGGFLIAAGTKSHMNKAMTSAGTTQVSIFMTASSNVAANTIFRLQDSNGNDIVTFAPLRAAGSLMISSPALVKGASYSIYTGGSVDGGTVLDGLYSGGSYSNGTFKKTITLSSSAFVNSNISF
jgi:hypothetical protein